MDIHRRIIACCKSLMGGVRRSSSVMASCIFVAAAFAQEMGPAAAVSTDVYRCTHHKVIFPVSKTAINEKDPGIRELVEKVIPEINADSLELDSMTVRGAASPEGPYLNNVRLGQERCAHLFEYVNARLRFPAQAGSYRMEPISEDYEGLCQLMQEAHDPLYNQVSALVKAYPRKEDFAVLKRKLQALDHGKAWRHLLATYFPQLRAARATFFFTKRKPEPQREETVPDSLVIIVPVAPPIPVDAERLDTSVAETSDSVMVCNQRLVRRHVLALRTNLLYDFFYLPGHYWAPTPNVQLEYYPRSGHVTANLGFTFPYWHKWSTYQFWQARDYMLEGRYYFRGHGEFCGLYTGLYAHVNKYGIGLSKTKGWEGEGIGGGAMIGYVMNISRSHRWRMEFSLGIGYYHSKYDPYVYGNPKNGKENGLYYYDYLGSKSTFRERKHHLNWVGPTNVGIHLTYDLLYRRIQKRGVSFLSTEEKTKGGGL